ncbi:hypothetical protein [Devosia sp.]|uniref:hypothetical protein n=1 Tax=Devosia sp. TaxID=1871048 RepID=UPI003BA9730B
MHKMIVAGAATLFTALAGIGSASAFERHFTIQTANGVLTGTAQMHCSNGKCERQLKIKTADGETLLRTSSCVKDAPRVWTCTVKGSTPQAAGSGKSFTLTVN